MRNTNLLANVTLCVNYLFVCADVVSEKNTLTTMTPREAVWPKPTAPLRRYNHEEKLLPGRNDLQALSLKNSRRSVAEDNFEWGWDKWCQLQPKVGDCLEQRTFFYYQAQTDSCREFTYTGCNGNQNKFSTRTDCERFCKGFGTVIETKSLSQIETCSMQPDPGNCFAYLSRYYYDVNHGKCREFVFGGCGGNPNRFPDQDTCMEKCYGVFYQPRART